MQDFIERMSQKVGIDHATAERVVEFLKENSGDAIAAIKNTGALDKLPGGLGDKVGKLF